MSNKPKCIVMDLDGTLYNSQERVKKHTKPDGSLDFDNLHKEILELDKLNKWVYDIHNGTINWCNHDEDISTIVLTGRNERARKDTETILKKDLFDYSKLIMREIDDYRSAYEFKKEYLMKIKEEYDIITVFDDDLSVILMCRELNINGLFVNLGQGNTRHDLTHMKQYVEDKLNGGI